MVHCITCCAEWFQYQATKRVNGTLNTESIYHPFSKSSTQRLLYWTTDQTTGLLHIKMRGNSNCRSFGLSKMCVFNSPKLGCSGVCKSSAVQVGSDQLWSDSRGIKVSPLQTSWEPISLLARSVKVNLQHYGQDSPPHSPYRGKLPFLSLVIDYRNSVWCILCCSILNAHVDNEIQACMWLQ